MAPAREVGTECGQETGRVLPVEGRIRVGKRLSDIRKTKRTRHRVVDGVVDRVAIGVSDRANGVLEPHSREYARSTPPLGSQRLEPMKVVSVSDAE